MTNNLFAWRTRTTDPDTSHEAAATLRANNGAKLTEYQEFALAAVRSHPGLTAAELERQYDVPDGRIRKRLHELFAAGKIMRGQKRKCRVTGGNAYPWIAVDSSDCAG